MITQPKYVGGYKLGNLILNLTKKPCLFHRTMVKLILGWEWRDD